ncbi:MAG: glycosyl hydrolase family 18 protein [Acidobacteriota bacterium]
MKKIMLSLISFFICVSLLATVPPEGIEEGSVTTKSIHQIELEKYSKIEMKECEYPLYYSVKEEDWLDLKSNREETLSKTIYGFMPYWVVSDLSKVQWDLLTHVAYFSVGVNSDGSLTNQSGSYAWPNGSYVQALISLAHSNSVKVTLTATLFNSSSISTLLSNSTYRQNAINNLLAQVQAGNADGVCIDFEGVSSTQKANLVTFITDLTNAFHSAIPGSHVSICTPAVDWSGAFDYDQIAVHSDGMFIMGYDYYWKGSSTAGPVSPRMSSSRWGTYCVNWTINDYITYGGSENKSKFILGLPYYGYEWPTSSTSVPSSTTGTGTAKVYDSAKAGAQTYGRQWDSYGEVPYYVNSSGPYQCFYDDGESLGLKWDLVNSNNLGGTGMWALNYDKSDTTLWDTLESKFSTTPSGDMSGIKIGIDPGHGGTDSGAVGPTGLKEKEINLAGSLMLRDALLARGASVYMTRTTDVDMSLTARSSYFNSIPVDRAESFHHNASGTPSANYTGVHIYWTDSLGCGAASQDSRDMASKTALRLDSALNIGVVSSNCTPSIYGVHGDDFHMVRETTMPAMLTEASFISNPTEEALLYTNARRCLIAGAIAKGIEDHYGKTAQDPPCASGTCGNPILIDTFPYTDNNSTLGRNESLNNYSCPPSSGSEAGPEVVYLLSIPLAGTLTVTVTDGSGVDIDPHLLTSCDPASCLARDDTTFSIFLQPGSYYLVCDTWTSSTNTKYPGAYTLNVNYSPDTTAPAEVQNLKWQNGRWEWDAVTLDRLGNSETMGYYQMWRADNIQSWNFSLLQDKIASNNLEDSSVPPADTCYYYYLHAVDAAGNRDNPHTSWTKIYTDATYSGSWSNGSNSDCLGGSGQYKYASTQLTPTATATWSTGIEEAGNYLVSVRYVAGTTNRTMARYTVYHSNGNSTVQVDQTTNNCLWIPLGNFTLRSGTTYSVVLDNQATVTGKVVIAEGVKWEKQ